MNKKQKIAKRKQKKKRLRLKEKRIQSLKNKKVVDVKPKKLAPKKKASPKKKAAPKKAAPKKAAPKKAAPKKVATKKVTPKKAAPKKVIKKKDSPKKSLEKRTVAKKEEFLPEQYVVYPSHGIGQILEIEKKEIAGQMLTMYVIEFEKEKMTLRVPIEKTKEIGVRKVSTKNQLKDIFEILTGKAKIRRTMWSRRAQEYEAKINSGDIKLLTEVVRDLFRSDSQPEQSYSERQLYEAARERLSREVAVIEKTDEQKAIEKMETILNNSNGRNEELSTEDQE